MRTELYLQIDRRPNSAEQALCEQCKRAVVTPAKLVVDRFEEPVRLFESGDDPADKSGRWVVRGGLLEALRLRERHPEVTWIPFTPVYRPTPTYELNRSQHGSGFVFYAPRPATLASYATAEGIALYRWLEIAVREGFDTIWLHGEEAARRGDGLPLDVLERARGRFDGEIWLSGGARELQHLHNLTREGGCAALVLPIEQVVKWGLAEVRGALRGPLEVAVALEEGAGNAVARRARTAGDA